MSATSDPAMDPVQVWQNLYVAAGRGDPTMRACVAAGFHLADQVWRQVAADPTLDPHTRTRVSGETSWARTALAAYHHLANTRAYDHLSIPATLRCRADQATLRAWLNAPSPLPGFGDTSVADTWDITDHDFHWEADDIATRMSTLVEQAHQAGVYGVPGYTISLRHLAADLDAIIEHQVTLHTPSGVVLASDPIATDHLADDELSGVDAALAVLANTAAVANELLAAEQRLAAAGFDTHLGTAAPARPHRGFTGLDLTTPPIAPAGFEPSPAGPARHPHR